MTNGDTIELLKECDAGAKMAVSSIDDVLDSVQNPDLKQLLINCRNHHKDLGDEIHRLLVASDSHEKDPAPIAKGMSWMKTNMKLSMDGSDETVADLITDGCNMGVKSLYRYLNQYHAADTHSKDLCILIASSEEQLARDLRKYL